MSGKHERRKVTLIHPRGFEPQDWLRFIQLTSFTKEWKRLELSEEELMGLEMLIMASPDGPPVVPGTGGLRKGRFAPSSWKTGKSGAARVLYVYFPNHCVVVLVSIYSKSEKGDLDHGQKSEIKKLLKRLEEILDQEHSKRAATGRAKPQNR